MNISVRLEGGLGDCLCANRFIPAIKEKFPDAKITAYIDSEGNPMQENALREFYGDFYKNIITIPSKKYKPFYVNTQFGLDQNYGALENIPDEYITEMTTKYDRFYDLHIDGLKWVDYDFNWMRYFYTFPKPFIKKQYEGELSPKYVVAHLASNNLGNSHRMEEWYVKGLISKIAQEIPVLVLSTPSTRDYLSLTKDIKNVKLIESSLEDVIDIISRSSAFIGIDSGLKYFAYGLGIPTYTYSAQAYELGKVLPSHKLRWLMYESACIPLHYDFNAVSRLIVNTVSNKAYSLVSQLNDFDSQAVRRHYKVNQELSKLQ